MAKTPNPKKPSVWSRIATKVGNSKVVAAVGTALGQAKFGG